MNVIDVRVAVHLMNRLISAAIPGLGAIERRITRLAHVEAVVQVVPDAAALIVIHARPGGGVQTAP